MRRLASVGFDTRRYLKIRPLGQCTRQRSFNDIASRRSKASSSSKQKTRSVVVVTSVIGAAGLALLARDATRDKIGHVFSAARRTGRVVGTLVRCILDYQRTLRIPTENNEHYDIELSACHQRCAERALKVMESNGSIFIKLGQHLSSMDYLLPREWTTTFIPLQDQCPISSFEAIEKLFVKDINQSVEEIFETFEKVPTAAASLAQVHLATLKNSKEKVAVKVQHPILEEWVPLDLALTRLTFSALTWAFPSYNMTWLSKEMEISLPQELDFTLEGAFAMQTKKHFESLSDYPLVVPVVNWCSRRILVMEYIAGRRLDDLEYLDTNNIDRDEVSAALARIFNEMIFGNTPLHCDPHGGNIAIRRSTRRMKRHNFDIILYDHGLYRHIPLELSRNYAKLWLAVMDSNEQKMREYSYRVAGITDDQFPLFASVITGRDYMSATQSIVSKRTAQEKETISSAMGDGLFRELVQLLGNVPRLILLLLKTNDLTRSLDENLHTKEGPTRNFLILARYCSRTVFEEQRALVRQSGRLIHPMNILKLLAAWGSFLRVELQLSVYEWYIFLRRFVGSSALYQP
ncbi:uncharacterized protein KY384_006943 [Bacidia gigantensis]|uniref:uncharacterized protein n=1 Tax=Bacidia gigantensis TaxID=2732470 RepID=UPI001D042C7E|nr:uncharacterized protein KY384_006943 [Bacidia gigantensis]KAG8528027.1 hypothetical protein KY384_006943 [Bacidia gigantensis]